MLLTYVQILQEQMKMLEKQLKIISSKNLERDHLGSGVLGSDAKKGSANVQDAHEAIRPTRPEIHTVDGLKDEQQSLYGLIWARFAGSQMSNSVRED